MALSSVAANLLFDARHEGREGEVPDTLVLPSTPEGDSPAWSRQAIEYNLRIREMPSADRPRERLRDHGASALTTAELLAIILRTGGVNQNVLSLAQSLLHRNGGLGGLARLPFSELVNLRGLGEAKASEIIATFALAARLNALQPEDKPYVRSPADVMNLLGGEMALLEQESLRVIVINTRNQVMSMPEVYKGNVGGAIVRVAEVLREAVRQNAVSLILVHNHPSGDPSPSPDDVVMTKSVVEGGKLLGIDVLDHIIVGQNRFASLKQLGLGGFAAT